MNTRRNIWSRRLGCAHARQADPVRLVQMRSREAVEVIEFEGAVSAHLRPCSSENVQRPAVAFEHLALMASGM